MSERMSEEVFERASSIAEFTDVKDGSKPFSDTGEGYIRKNDRRMIDKMSDKMSDEMAERIFVDC